MVFLAEQTVPVPTKDIISWIFDDLSYDGDKPVSTSHRLGMRCMEQQGSQS